MPSIDLEGVLNQPTLMTSAAASRRLYLWGLAVLIVTCFWFINETHWVIDRQTVLGIGIMAIASRPALTWANRNYTWFPAFEIAMLTCIPFYAIPLLARHPELRYYPESVIVKASLIVILFIAVSSLTFSLLKRPPRPAPSLSASLIPTGMYKLVPIGIVLSNLHLIISAYTNLIPASLTHISKSILFGMGTLSIFISSRLWGVNLLSKSQKILFSANISIQVILLLSGLYLISGISVIALAIISYSMAKRSVPWIIIILTIPILSILHLGKGAMRGIYWKEHGAIQETREISELPAFFIEWFNYGLQAERVERETRIQQSSIFERASLIHMLCMCVDRVPRDLPHLNGDTYIDIPGILVPRFLWPDKPSSLQATQRLATYFNLIHVDAIGQVSVAFGVLSEAYVNFGIIGVIVLAILFGLGFKRVAQLSQHVPLFSALGILSILLTAWSFQIEQSAATWISSLFQAALLCIGLPLAYRKLTAH